MRTVILGDVHLGSPLCRSGQLLEMLRKVHFDRLILNGDIFDDLNFRRLKDRHWAVLNELRLLQDRCEVIWICGNHDGSPEALKRLLGVSVVLEYTFDFRGETVYVVHGHEFDRFQHATKGLRTLRDKFYGFAIWFDVPRKTAIQWAQRSTTLFARAAAKVKHRAIQKARKLGARYVVVGHTHHREIEFHPDVTYANPSSWLTSNPAYVLFDDRLTLPSLVVMGAREPKPLGRSVKTRVKKAGRRLAKTLQI